MSVCKYCKSTKKYWKGDERKCYVGYGYYNWNCETVNRLRSLQYLDSPLVNYYHHNDQSTLQIDISDILEGRLYLWMTWYKDRGRTDKLYILSDIEEPRKPTIQELYEIVKYFEGR